MVKLFVDFDNTIVDTTEAFCKYFNDVYMEDYNLGSIKGSWVKEYDFSDVISISENELIKAFKSERLFSYLRPYPYVRYALETLKKSGYFQIYLVSNCSAESAIRKLKWLDEFDLAQYFDGTIMLNINQAYNKSLVDMTDSILIDDHHLNHSNSNAKWKFCYTGSVERNWHPKAGDGVFLFNHWASEMALDKILKIGAENK